jgi:hypothetical protein
MTLTLYNTLMGAIIYITQLGRLAKKVPMRTIKEKVLEELMPV